jgi:hypothetical protein
MAITARTIETAVEAFNEIAEQAGTNEFADLLQPSWRGTVNSVELPGVGPATYVDGKLPREGGGEEIFLIFTVADTLGSVYFRMTGYYTSYEGAEWGEATFEEVRPEEKTITVYVPAKA